MLCSYGAKPQTRNFLGLSAFDCACGSGNLETVNELLAQAQDELDFSICLHMAMWYRGGSLPESSELQASPVIILL